MGRTVEKLFDDSELVEKIKRRLPHLFHYAERDSSRAGKIGMEVGSLRERILVALLVHRFGPENVETELPITEHEVDVKVSGEPLSIKTLTTSSNRIGAVKAIWTVDAERARKFVREFEPSCDYLVVQITWGKQGGLYYIPVEAQRGVIQHLSSERYFKLPKPGTNPRGVEISREAMRALVEHGLTKKIEIEWRRPTDKYDPYERWVENWRID
ncbi:MAG: ThaI family type II restriction endonuclease [Candidatus Eisenbacteria sp.]|nr:ThaI family type II restriction endonuclease [Candidatus Eisenbacteria bacterium]